MNQLRATHVVAYIACCGRPLLYHGRCKLPPLHGHFENSFLNKPSLQNHFSEVPLRATLIDMGKRSLENSKG